MTEHKNCLILGAGGRDFHDFLTYFKPRPELHVVGFTAAQIPFISSRRFPRSLAGPSYEQDIPIYPEEQLWELIHRLKVDLVYLAYSDLSHLEVMHKASIVLAAGASFVLLGPKDTQLVSRRPVIAVTASRTGAGKSPIAQAIAQHLGQHQIPVAVLRHPMPYGDLEKQAVERFGSLSDLDRFECTLEEREEYTPYLERGLALYAGVDYAKILAAAEAESKVILWDGGNNDFSFVRPTLSIVVLDALRPGHELAYHPGEVNLRSADVLVINKVGRAAAHDVGRMRARAAEIHPRAIVLEGDLAIESLGPSPIAGRRVLVIEDGPTVTHGGMPHGAGLVAARAEGAAVIIDPRPFAIGSIAEAYRAHPHLGPVLPALGYSPRQRQELEQTIRLAAPEVVVDGSPARVASLLQLEHGIARVIYRFVQTRGEPLASIVDRAVASR